MTGVISKLVASLISFNFIFLQQISIPMEVLMAVQSVATVYQQLFLDYDSDEDLPVKKRKTISSQIKFFVERTISHFSDEEFQKKLLNRFIRP